MKTLILSVVALLLTTLTYGQKVYQIRADSVRIYNVCDTAELILENRTQNVKGFLFNKGYGRTEFQKLKLQAISPSRIAIVGQDTLDLGSLPGIGGAGANAGSGLIKLGDSLHLGGSLTRDTKLDLNRQSFYITNGNGSDTSYAIFGDPKNILNLDFYEPGTQNIMRNGNLFVSKAGYQYWAPITTISQTPKRITLSAFGPATIEDGGSLLSLEEFSVHLASRGGLSLAGESGALLIDHDGLSYVGAGNASILLSRDGIFDLINENGVSAIKLDNDSNGSLYFTGKFTFSGQSTFNDLLTFTRPLSDRNKLIDLQQGYGIWSDNQDGIDETLLTSRLWFDAPNGGSMVLGPRTGINYMKDLRIKSNQIRLEGANNAWTNILALGTNATGDLINTSGSFIQNQTATTQNASFMINGAATATGFYQSSKASLKRDITDFNESGLSLLKDVNIKQFIYKSDKENYLHFGIIADSTDWHFAGKEHDRFDTNNSLAITMKAVQELSDIKDKQEKEIESLKSENEKLKQQMAEIMKRVESLEKK